MRELVKLLEEGESETVEYKPSLSQTDKILECVSAFSNTNGGTLVIGVKDNGEVVGVDIGKRTIENLANRIKQHTDPMVYPSICIEDLMLSMLCYWKLKKVNKNLCSHPEEHIKEWEEQIRNSALKR